MAKQTAITKARPRRTMIAYGALWLLVLLTYCSFLFNVFMYVALGLPIVGAAYLLLFGLLFWSSGGLLITIPLTIYLDKHFADMEYGKVDAVYSRWLKIFRRLPVRQGRHMALIASNLGMARLCQGHFDSAQQLFEEAVKHIDSEPRWKKTGLPALYHNNLAVALIRQNRLVEAELHAANALEMLPKKVREKKPFFEALVLAAIGTIRLRLSELDSAEEYLLKAKSLYERGKLPPGIIESSRNQGRAMASLGLAHLYAMRQQWSLADQFCEEALECQKIDQTCMTTQALWGLSMLANEYMNARHFERAEQLLDLAYSLGQAFPFHPDALQTLNCLEKLFLLTDRENEIADMRSWLRLSG